MELEINQEVKSVQSANLEELLSELDIPAKGIAIAVEQQVVPKTNWKSTLLKENQKIIIIKATQGG